MLKAVHISISHLFSNQMQNQTQLHAKKQIHESK